ncbi:MAG: hypothetical protein Fur0032_02760 [Terrimicrobiaceae bacterium]
MSQQALPDYAKDPRRFLTSPGTLWLDRVMTWVIRLGGALVITSVLGIFVFIFAQIWPLFAPAGVREIKTLDVPPGDYEILGVDEWGRLPFLLEPDGDFLTVNAETGEISTHPIRFSGANPAKITAATFNRREQKLILGTSDGLFCRVALGYRSEGTPGNQTVSISPTADALRPIGVPGLQIDDIAYGDAGTVKMVVALQHDDAGVKVVTAALYKRKRTLMGTGKEELVGTYNLTKLLPAPPKKILVAATGDSVVVTSQGGVVTYLGLNSAGEDFEVWQTFRPFEDLANQEISVSQFLFGDVSLIFGGEGGANRVFSLFYHEGDTRRLFGLTRTFPDLGQTPDYIATTLRNKAFFLLGGDLASLRFSTTTSIRWQEKLPYEGVMATISGKYDRLMILDNQSKLHVFDIDDPHPDSGWKALFGKIWYEGADGPQWVWQSTGGSDDFEPKYSIVPLLFGTIKGTVYAMLFAVPIALMAALYTSQFLEPNLRKVIKPTMEIMASLPSVVLGFLAAIYIAPLIERQVPSLLLVAAGLPLAAAIFGGVWSNLPIQVRHWVRPGREWLAFLPLLLVVGGVLWYLGPAFERVAFIAVDPSTGERVADFRYWWPAATGATFDQRNSLVVGFMMGFAVIPIIFTIAEDALSNVPLALRTASMACGASRWQTAFRVVLPTASAGIFSALMIGLGRAVGETMIVVMATGNTPIMEWNVFSGMRTLSANIAVELPEAPHSGTLYRTLFFGALLLFLLTFAINTLAEILRQHLREKFKTI